MSDICRYCKVQGNHFQKLTPTLLRFVKWKVPSVKENDVFCKSCYLLVKNKYEQVKTYQQNKKKLDATATSAESITSKLAINDTETKLIALKKRKIVENDNSDKSSPRSSSFSLTISEESNDIEINKSSPKNLRQTQLSIRPFAEHVTQRVKPKEKSKTTSIIQMKNNSESKNVKKSITTRNSANEIQPIVPQKILPEMEEVAYDVSDEDIFDPGISYPTIQPLIKRRKIIRSKREPINWSYKLGG